MTPAIIWDGRDGPDGGLLGGGYRAAMRTGIPTGPLAGGGPDEFGPRLAAARLYLHFRWLGGRREWTTHKESRWRFAELRRAADQMGIINTTGRGFPKRSRIAPGPRATQLISRVY